LRLQAALPRSRWMVCSRVSLSASLSQHLPAATYLRLLVHFWASARSAACTYDTSAWWYKCMMSPGNSPPATRGFIWHHPAPIWTHYVSAAPPKPGTLVIISHGHCFTRPTLSMEYYGILNPRSTISVGGMLWKLVTPRIRDAHVSRELSIILCSVPAP